MKGLLQRVQCAIRTAQALDSEYLPTICLYGEHQARTNRRTIKDNCTGAAHAVLTSNMSPLQVKNMPQEVAEQQACLNLHLMGNTVHAHMNQTFLL
jgi:hypothetical protein